MKKILLASAAIGVIVFTSKAQTATLSATGTTENPNAPEIVFEKDVMDYGTVKYDSDGTREFKFKNTGKEPLIIYSATGSCGCTVPTAPKEPIKPGDSGVIKVHYDTKRVGSFEKSITVSSNAKIPSKILKVKGTVEPAVNPPAPITTSPK